MTPTSPPRRYQLEQFQAVRRFGELSWSHDGRQVFYVSNISGQINLWRQDALGGWPHPMTAFEERTVREVAVSPDGGHVIFTADRVGDENHQIYRLDLDGGWPAPLTDLPHVQHMLAAEPHSPDGRFLAYTSNERHPACMDIRVLELATGRSRILAAEDGVLVPVRWSPDGRLMSAVRVLGNTDQDILIVDAATGETRNITHHPGGPPTMYHPGPWAPDGSGLYVLTNEGREFHGLAFHDLATDKRHWVLTPEWNVAQVDLAVTPAGRTRLLWVVNEGGRFLAYGKDLATGEPLPLPDLPQGVVAYTRFRCDGGALLFSLETARHAADVYVSELDASGGPGLRRLTTSMFGNLREEDLVEPAMVHYPTFDGRQIPAWLYQPRGASARDRRPVVLSIHGGPEWQELPHYTPLYQYLLSRGIGVLAPNVRGSTGYGRSYQRLIYRDWGGDELKDFEHAALFLRGLDWVDAERVGVYGGSFGGFATLGCVSRLPQYWRCGVDIVGPSNLLSFCRSVPEHWKRYIAELVGDPATEEDFLLERSPITYADRIRCPLLVVQGANDPRVKKAESDQMVERFRGRGGEVEYLLLEDEGHGMTKRANALKVERRVVEFLEKRLLGDACVAPT